MENEFKDFVPDVHFEQIPIKNLVSNQDYQRSLSKKHVEAAAKHFDLYQINPVKVSRRDGVNYVFNGQHTIEIIRLVSGSKDTPVWCMIYDDLEYTHEAEIFANQQKFVKPLSPVEIFKANIEANNDKQMIIKELVESFGFKISSIAKPGYICAVATMENIYDKYGYAMLDHVLKVLIGTWDGEPPSLNSSMLMGMARFLEAYSDIISDESFKERLGVYSAREIARAAKEKRNGSLGYGETLLVFYNKRARNNPISFEPLYAGKKTQKRRKKKDVFNESSNVAVENEVTYDEESE